MAKIRRRQKNLWNMLSGAAAAELEQILAELPGELVESARDIPVTFEERPGPDMVRDGIGEDTLGLFVGPSHGEAEVVGDALPPQIIVFLLNHWDFAGQQPSRYRGEVRRTILHELGHYLGFDEFDLQLRDLD